MNPSAADLIRHLNLQPLPGEGGWYRETWRGTQPSEGGVQGRSVGTAIYYLLRTGEQSVMHRLPCDEVFHHYAGAVVEMLLLGPGGVVVRRRLGGDVLAGDEPQVLVPAGWWQGSRVADGGDWALMGTTVAPGFEFHDLELGCAGELIAEWAPADATLGEEIAARCGRA